MNEQFSHQLKLNQASHHLDSLDAKVRAWGQGETHRYVPHFDRESGEQLFYLEFVKPIPAEFRLIIGDCLHNLRSALDNLVYELALAYVGIDPLPEHRARSLEFPIFGDRPMKEGECRNKIGCIHPDAQTIIKGLQPHNRGDEFASDPFWKLHQLNNMDKHRAPHVTQMAVSAYSDFPDAPLLPGTININPFRDGAQIASYTPRTSAFAEGFDPQVHMDPLLTFGISFGKGSAAHGLDCGVALKWIRNHIVNDAFRPLEEFLT